MTKPETTVSMKDFMATKLGYVVWNSRKIEKMAQEQFIDGQDLFIHTQDEIFVIPKNSIADYFAGSSEPLPKVTPNVSPLTVEEPPKEDVPVVETPTVGVEVATPVVLATRKAGRPKKEVNV